MADLPNVSTIGVQSASEALHELKHEGENGKKPGREKGKRVAEDALPEEELIGDSAEQEEHQLDVLV